MANIRTIFPEINLSIYYTQTNTNKGEMITEDKLNKRGTFQMKKGRRELIVRFSRDEKLFVTK